MEDMTNSVLNESRKLIKTSKILVKNSRRNVDIAKDNLAKFLAKEEYYKNQS